MNNEITNELATARCERMRRFGNPQITDGVFKAMGQIDQSAVHGLQGIDASNDGITRELFEQALASAEMDGSLVFPGYVDTIPADAEPVSFEIAQQVVFGRVARAILVINGYARGFDVAGR
jgi:hypothetical protein